MSNSKREPTDNLTKDNILLYAAKCYDRPNMIQAEFEDDFRRIQYIKRLITKFRSGKDLKEHLVINHLIIFSNVFGVVPANRLLFLAIEEIDWPILKPFLVYLSILQDVVLGINNRDIYTDMIDMNPAVIQKLRGFNNGIVPEKNIPS